MTAELARFLHDRYAEEGARIRSVYGVSGPAYASGAAGCEAVDNLITQQAMLNLLRRGPSPRPYNNWSRLGSWAEPVLRALALPYADHPGYRDEWRPDAPTA
ncbi:DUF6221 family protein [Streptomyces sp. NPDC051987]|uniref:DUF6221 family protein n=1 Tax=Streptomyces sp. NPDC051987 TaxID=3155808 RepID=UPI00341913FF